MLTCLHSAGELRELPIEFQTPGSPPYRPGVPSSGFLTDQGDGKLEAVLEFRFAASPGYTTTVKILESVRPSFQWRSQFQTVRDRDGRVVGSGYKDGFDQNGHSVKDGRTEYDVACQAYDRTDDLTPFKITDERERLRYHRVNGPAFRREYTRGNLEHADHLDLWRQLLGLRGEGGVLFRQTVNALVAQGFKPTHFHGYERFGIHGTYELLETKVSCPGVPFCDVEKFSISHVYTGNVRQFERPAEDWFINVRVSGTIHRDMLTRAIRRYIVEEVQTAAPRDKGGGGSSTSGGRISGY